MAEHFETWLGAGLLLSQAHSCTHSFQNVLCCSSAPKKVFAMSAVFNVSVMDIIDNATGGSCPKLGGGGGAPIPRAVV